MECENPELRKLDNIDRKLVAWMVINDPDALPSWIEQAVREYRHRKNIEIDPERLMREIGLTKDEGCCNQRS